MTFDGYTFADSFLDSWISKYSFSLVDQNRDNTVHSMTKKN